MKGSIQFKSLSIDIAHKYMSNRLHDGNTLAKIILQKTPFDKGHYFALLKPTADKNKLHSFHSGGILPPNPLEPVAFGGKLYPGRKKRGFGSAISRIFRNSYTNEMCCYFEDLVHQKQDPIAVKFKTHTLYY
jgi:hypothetical protein